MRRWVLSGIAVVVLAVLPSVRAEAAGDVASGYRERLERLYRETHHADLLIDAETAWTKNVEYQGRSIDVTVWRAASPQGPVVAFAAPDVATVLGVFYEDRSRVDAWQLAGRVEDSPLDSNVVGLPFGDAAPQGIGFGDLLCGLVTGVVFGALGAALCLPAAPPVGSIVCGAAGGGMGGVGGTAACALGDEETGRLQWNYTEDDPLGTKKTIRIYDNNYPEEGVHFTGRNYLCMQKLLAELGSTDPDGPCYQVFAPPGEIPYFSVRHVWYRAKVKWSDRTKTEFFFDSPWTWFENAPVYHQSAYYMPDGYDYTIDVKVEQLVLTPTDGFQWMTVGRLSAFAAVCPSCDI